MSLDAPRRMRVKVRMQASAREHAALHAAMQRHRLTRKTIYVLVLGHHGLTFLVAIALGGAHFASATEVLGGRPPSGVAYLLVGLLHLSACMTWAPTHLIAYAPYLHALEMAAHVYTASNMAATLVEPSCPLGFAYLVALHMAWTSKSLVPPMVCAKRPTLRTPLVSLSYALLSFYVSVGYVLWVLVVPAATTISHFRHQSRDFDWAATHVPTWRFVLSSEPLDIATRLIALVATYVRLHTVVAAVRVVPSRVKRTHTLNSISEDKTSDGRRAVLRLLPATKELLDKVRPGSVAKALPVILPANRRWRVGLYFIYNLLALTLLVLTTHRSYFRLACPPGCRVASPSWANERCHCVYFRWDCAVDGPMDAWDTYFQILSSPTLLWLHLQRCPLPNGLRADTLALFPCLYGLHFEASELRRWDIPQLPSTIASVFLHGTNLRGLPPALLSPPLSLQTLYVTDSPALGDLPSTVYASWHALRDIALTNTSQTSLSGQIQKLQALEYLDVGHNALTELPPELTKLPHIQLVFADHNQLVEIPAALVAAYPSLQLVLNSNPISTVPLSLLNAVQLHLIHVASTTYCNATRSSVCYRDCAPSCAAPRVGDNYCDSRCNVLGCNYDGGDCLPLP
ncbi:hypothetical protein SDRG_06095 [Saprolegnia diclina VS20]|uniref:LNR domain-containing protein n=1 Tax=Saprolegnia diclina (strain VS20) TaxID=1156394 RepID=T0RVZ9_SAPDV|nr:hypothetical protein SDRG_06095 [Saprolegnia diclina VS20]EQC36658.1 hypothetical protein SDRG_06095 [Saprolegnia diclina VS20]|eukprot:XP_008610079.1 hypothetical protein SDRG_06095 [Saprolegnia diclina VS20]